MLHCPADEYIQAQHSERPPIGAQSRSVTCPPLACSVSMRFRAGAQPAGAAWRLQASCASTCPTAAASGRVACQAAVWKLALSLPATTCSIASRQWLTLHLGHLTLLGCLVLEVRSSPLVLILPAQQASASLALPAPVKASPCCAGWFPASAYETKHSHMCAGCPLRQLKPAPVARTRPASRKTARTLRGSPSPCCSSQQWTLGRARQTRLSCVRATGQRSAPTGFKQRLLGSQSS